MCVSVALEMGEEGGRRSACARGTPRGSGLRKRVIGTMCVRVAPEMEVVVGGARVRGAPGIEEESGRHSACAWGARD